MTNSNIIKPSFDLKTNGSFYSVHYTTLPRDGWAYRIKTIVSWSEDFENQKSAIAG